MAKIFLTPNETFNLGANSVADFVGNGGAERVSVVSTNVITADQNVERIDLPNDSSTYKFAVAGNEVKIYTATTNVLVATYYAGGTNQVVAFNDGAAPLVMTGLNAVKIGGVAIPAVAATIAPTVNPADISSTAVSATPAAKAASALAIYTTAADAYTTAKGIYDIAVSTAATKAAAVTNVATANESVTAAQAVSTAATNLKAAAVVEKVAAAALKTATDATTVTTDDAAATAAVSTSAAHDTTAAGRP